MTKLNTELFIERAIKAHGNKYDYSKTEFTKSKEKLTVICKIHGEFSQRAANHIRGEGCQKCAWEKPSYPVKIVTEEWIKKAKQIHGDRYDYSLTQYHNNRTKVKIICKDHGVFEQSPLKHVSNGNGCPECAGYVKGVAGFIEKARKAHGDKYDYSKAIYKGARDRLEIICPEHGSFWQIAGSHTTGRGCDLCARVTRGKTRRTKKDEFIEQAIKRHNGKYDYTNLHFTKMHDLTVFTCPVHGEFAQSPTRHLNAGCRKCAGMGQDLEERIARARETHGDKYDYSKVHYTSPKKKVTITCPEHGDFQQTLISHIRGTGCPCCPQKRDLPAYVYILDNGKGFAKVGVSRVLDYRLYQLNVGGMPFECKVHNAFLVENKYKATLVEGAVHKILDSNRAGFTGFDGATEWFKVDADKAANITSQVIEMMQLSAA